MHRRQLLIHLQSVSGHGLKGKSYISLPASSGT
jgi:hypothetical protein